MVMNFQEKANFPFQPVNSNSTCKCVSTSQTKHDHYANDNRVSAIITDDVKTRIQTKFQQIAAQAGFQKLYER